MGLFGRKKINVVVKKRTPDITEYKIITVDYKEPKFEAKKNGFVSPLHGSNVKDEIVINRISNTPVTNYDAFRTNPINDTGINSKDPFPEFRKVKPIDGYESDTPSTTVKVEEEVEDTKEVREEEVKVQEKAPIKEVSKEELFKDKEDVKVDSTNTKAQVFPYDENAGEHPKFDRTLYAELFGVELNKDKKESEKKEVKNKEIKEEVEPQEDTHIEDKVEEEKPIVKEETKKEEKREVSYKNYVLPPLSLLPEPEERIGGNEEWNNNNIQIINQTLTNFRIDGQVKEYTEGPTFTRYAIMLGPGVPGNKISNIELDIQRSLAVQSIRIENPIPGKPYIGIEVPNKKRRSVQLKELICTEEFMNSKDPLLIPVGLDVEGKARYVSIEDFPHGLIAGSSGSGKSVFLSCMLASLLYKNSPETLRFFFIDPKQVDLSQFDGVPHLISPIVTEVKDGINSLKWMLDEMNRRFTVFRSIEGAGITKLKEYNRFCESHKEYKKIPYIIVVIDEAADFLLNAGNEAQDLITKLVQKSRAAGIHVILAMQKPISKILSTTIKSNTSARFAFRVTDRTDSMLMIDALGANDLLGFGDMMFYLSGQIGRYQGAFISGNTCVRIKQHCQSQAPLDYMFLPSELDRKSSDGGSTQLDDLFAEIARYVVYEGKCSMNAISNRFGIGFNRANAIVQSLEYYGIVSENLGTKPRQILVTEEEIEARLESIGVK